MNRRLSRHRLFLVVLVFFLVACALRPFAAEARPKKIVLIAGPITGHPKEAHEYEKNVILLKHLLETSPDLQGRVRVEAHFKGWPQDPSTLDDADTILITSDGTDRAEKDHPFYTGDHLQVIERQMKRGCGLVLYHWSTFHPVRFDRQVTEWVGGYFDYETGSAPNHWYSAIQTWQAESRPGTPGHPVLRGVRPFQSREEYYYRLRFRENDPRLKPIIVTRPPRETNDFTVGWAVERADGGRGFGFTGGHFYANWWNTDFRKLILNAVVWTARIEVPDNGVASEPFERFKVLIVTGHNHPAHDWIATTAALIPVLEQDPRAVVNVTENPEDLAGERTKDVDLLVLNYCNWERPGLSAAARARFVGYLQAGGGLAIIHFANGTWHPSLPKTAPEDAWPEYVTNLCRRVWEHRPPNASGHDAYGPFRVEVAGVRHPIVAGLAPFDTVDELYFHQQGALPIEPLAYAVSGQTKQREPMAWAYDYGRGRVFQTVLGHSADSVRKAAALVRRGSVWAAGRGPLAFDPPASLTEGVLFREGSPWTPEQALKRVAAAAAGAAEGASRGTGGGGGGGSGAGASPAAGLAGPLAQVAGAVASKAPAAPSVRPGTAVAGDELPMQGEKDWIDGRWSRTDLGRFLESTLRLPNGTVTKALTIRVGDHDEASVCFDTANLNLRAGWTGGFVKSDAARYGLLNPPTVDGTVQFVAPPGPGWIGATGRFGGFHVSGGRVVLEYSLGNVAVRESSSAEGTNGPVMFRRDLEVAPHKERLRLRLLDVPGHGKGQSNRHRWDGPPVSGESLEQGTKNGRMLIGRFGDGQLEVSAGSGSLDLVLDAASRPQRVRLVLRAPGNQDPGAAETPASWPEAPASLKDLARPGPARWLPAPETAGHVAPDSGPLAIDTLTVPYDNPWKALMFLSGVDFTGDGAAYVCSIHGDVWKVDGIDRDLKKLTWHRFATGLYQPLGLKVVKDQVYVLGRDRITRLRDENGDGEADSYENFCDLIETSPEPHHYVTSLETDDAGDFYYVDPVGAHRVSADGRAKETLATGFRNPNGMGVSPDGRIVTVAPQQGEWTPSSSIIEIREGGYYGYGGPKVAADRPLGYDPVFCWIPHGVDNSGGSQVWMPARAAGRRSGSADWGPLAGQLIHFSWGRCFMLLTLRDVVEGVPQGGVVALPGRFLSGAMRGGFNPRDGHLYVVGSTGWQTSALKDGCFQRVRYTGKPLDVPVAWQVRSNGITLTFSRPLDRESAEDIGSYGMDQWNYHYAAQYGSKDWSLSEPDQEGHDPVAIRSAKLEEDGRTVFLQIPDLRPVMQIQVKYNLNASDGAVVRGKFYGTVNRVPGATSREHH